MRYSHVVFDIDGTLIDSEKAVLKSLQKIVLEEKGIVKDLDNLKFALGIPGKNALMELNIENLDETEHRWNEYFNQYSNEVSIFKGIREVIQDLKSRFVTLGIITSKTKEEYKNDFMRFGLHHYFDVVICADDTTKHKPNGEPMEKYLEISNIKKEDVLYIGDSIYDMQCAENVGVHFALALWGAQHSNDFKATYKLKYPKNIIDILIKDDYKSDKLLDLAVELQFIAQTGLAYSKADFHIERFKRIREISANIVSTKSGVRLEKVNDLFCNEIGFQTPKLDTRAAIFKNGEILLVKEKLSKTWSLPGGWVDVNESIYSNTIKEVKEESGLDVIPERIIAVQDRNKHNKPRYIYGICKIFVLCNMIGGEFKPNIETSESKFFSLNDLPSLAIEKNTKEQIKMCFLAEEDKNWQVMFD